MSEDFDISLKFILQKGSTLELPKNWTKGPSVGVYTLVQLTTTDTEYQTVSQEFQRSCARQIVKVCNICNGFIEKYNICQQSVLL